MNSKKIDYDWVCHACSVENSKQVQQCHACGCSAFASMQTIEHHASEQRKADFQLSRDLAMQILFGAVAGAIALFFKFAL